jgi:spore coat protein A
VHVERGERSQVWENRRIWIRHVGDPARGLNVAHPIHIHLARFQVHRNGRNGPNRYQSGWKDTVSLSSGDSVELLVWFDGFRGKYVFHCHNLEHEDMMMMANFEVV